MNDFDKFKEELPNKEKFYNSLTNRKINNEEYEHVLHVWNNFEMKTMKDYHDLYLKCDILYLADVFEKFRNDSLKSYALCPSHYLSAPGLSWDAMLKMKKLSVNLFQILHFMKKRQKVEIIIFLIDEKRIKKRIKTYYILRCK